MNKKRLMYGVNAAFLILLVIGIFIFGNIVFKLILNKANISAVDITKEKVYSLSDQTKGVLKALNKDVMIYAFYPVGQEDPLIKELLNRYQKVSSHIKVQFIDVDKNPQLAKQLGVTPSDNGSILFKSGVQTRKVSSNDFSFYDEYTGEETISVEPKLTGAIVYVISNKLPNIYFTQGHQELNTDKDLSILKNNLQTETYNVNTVNLATESKVPDFIDILVVANPKIDFMPEEVDRLRTYLNNGGRVAFLYDVESVGKSLANLDKLVSEYGITPKNDIMIEGDPGKVLSNSLSFILPSIQSSTITDKLIENGLLVASVTTRSLDVVNENQAKALNTSVQPLLKTSKQSWARTDLTITTVKRQPSETQKEYTVAAISTKTIGNKQAKVFVSGDSTFITNTAIGFQGNNDYFLNVMGWMNDRKELISVRVDPKTIVHTNLDLTAKQIRNILIFIYILPLIILTFGIIVWMRRRKL